MGLLTKLKKLFKKEKEENKQSKTNARLSLNANTKVENYNSTNLESTDVAVDWTPKARPVRSQRFEQRMSRRRTLANERYYQEEKENSKRNTIGDWNE